MVQHNNSQGSENKLAILAITSKLKYKKNNLCPVIDDFVCVLFLEKSLPRTV
jgi:hypothetical protein